MVHPDSSKLITGSPSERRKYIDWVAFYLYPEFYGLWYKSQKIVKQRNAALKYKGTDSLSLIEHWTREFVKLQPSLFSFRQQALQALEKEIEEINDLLLNRDTLSFQMLSGYPADIMMTTDHLFDYHIQKLETDRKIQRTSNGSHTANLKVFFNGALANDVVSRGQLKMLTFLMVLAQSHTTKEPPIFAFDDLTSEIDSDNLKKINHILNELSGQVLITGTDEKYLSSLFDNAKVFHVKHGKIISRT